MKKRLKIYAITGFASPACLIVSDASKFKSAIFLEYKGVTVNLKNSSKSLMDLILISIKPGSYIEITANGCDEHKALQTIEHTLSKYLFIEPENSWN
ncbi:MULTISPECIES: HPr family phosphocarrier protein [Bacillus]|uniref:HPr family phosphocarrier protein n=1 Tax=Bacillus TaxID=1386 RepID=UPI000BA7AB2A|nr:MULTISPECIES: HPr family phosphocarrier protein [Bacillus]MDH3079476.1 HPr family phosphocarrier protein [Bacillus amyloliquefaciens]MDU0075942.1 HPr family phosphocarrier protein [Bacillus sp. IG2]MDU0101289.1 HPr family phosphocarrier protein [Bacillus sp. IS1]MEC2271710.1 HPr family phosphocarrier protein [Bacillus velezensis]MED3678141.1 HPr family phosphocarrier protein [Bacillus velezensis]